MIGKLLVSRRLGPLCLTQTCGAFNDNLMKNAMVVLALFKLSAGGAGLSALAGGLFIAPYAILSATAGQLADRFDKSRVIRATKAAEVLLMGLAAWAFLTDSVTGMLVVLFWLGAQAAMFGPLKYGILPDHLGETEIVAGNGLIEASTFMAILIGTVAGGGLVTLSHGEEIVGALGIAVSLIGLAGAFAVPKAPAADPSLRIGWNFLAETISVCRQAYRNRTIWWCVMGLSWMWTLGAILLSEFPIVARDSLHAGGGMMTLLLTVFAVGTGVGSILCARLLHGDVSARHVPFAAFGMTAFTWDFASAVASAHGVTSALGAVETFQGWRMMVDLFLLSACGGLYSVPLFAILQERSDPSCRARMVAANNIINALLMIAGAGFVALCGMAGFTPSRALHIAATVNFVVAIWIVRMLPQSVFRAVAQSYFKLFHGAKVEGLENFAFAGPRSVIVINHLSYLDGCLVAAFLPGDLVFAIDTEQAKRFWFLKYVIDVFPVDPTNPMSVRAMVHAVREGRRLAIFPEGRISLTGALMKIYDGPGMVADKADAMVVPVRIEGLQFHKTSRLRTRLAPVWFPKVSMKVLPPVRLQASAELSPRRRRAVLARQLEDVMADAAFRPERITGGLFKALLTARDLFDRKQNVLADVVPGDHGSATITELRYRRLIMGSSILGRKLAAFTQAGEHVGVMLPNAVPTVVTFFALQAYGRVAAMMNFTAGVEAMRACCQAAEIRTILTSRRAVSKGKWDRLVEGLSGDVRFVYLEDIRGSIGLIDKLRGMFGARSLPGASVAPESAAVVLFTSGSEGVPKGVVHSHRSILANCAQLRAIVDFHPADRVFNALPLFHAFGLVATLLPLLNGVRTFLYPSPLHYKLVPEMVYSEQATIMFGTDTFLTGYARKGHALDLQSLRYIFAGAEKVRPETRAAYWTYFKKPMFEGYGATETAPVLALSTWAHSREGSVGRLLPGIEARLEQVAGIEEGGRLFVRGPNVMLGYLRAEHPGVLQPPPDGWYDTGDIVIIDEDGFVSIVGRAKRFAKIGGEMVSLAAAESLAGAVWDDAVHAVVAVPDPRKGEKLLLVTTQRNAEPRAMLALARERGVAEIAVPRDILVVDKMPLLGAGKVDYPAVQRLVAERALVPA